MLHFSLEQTIKKIVYEYLKSVQRAIIFDSQISGIVYRKEVSILAKLVSYVNRFYCQQKYKKIYKKSWIKKISFLKIKHILLEYCSNKLEITLVVPKIREFSDFILLTALSEEQSHRTTVIAYLGALQSLVYYCCVVYRYISTLESSDYLILAPLNVAFCAFFDHILFT